MVRWAVAERPQSWYKRELHENDSGVSQMGELYNPYPKLPKNTRQIGERDQSVRLYLEDYVNTYLKRLFPKGGQDLRVGVLLGTSEEHDGIPYLFVDGALEMEDVAEQGEKVELTESAWKKVYQDMDRLFPKRSMLGWFLCGAPGAALSPLNYWKQHGQYFAGKNQLMYLNSGLEGEEAVYITSEDGFYKLRGYHIYYERNQMMQDYMIMRKDVRRVETGTGEPVVRDFRQRMEENKNQVTSRRSSIRVLGSLCSALAMVVLAGGVVMVNNYDKMQKMESVLTSVLPEGISWESSLATGESSKNSENALRNSRTGRMDDGTEANGDNLLVEHASGGVNPTLAHETMSETYPGADGQSSAGTDGESRTGEANKTGADGNTQTGTESKAAGDGVDQTTADSSGNRGSANQNAASSATDSDRTAISAALASGTYQIQPGETLYGICLKLYGNGSRLEEICRLNGLEDENKIMAGQNLILPQ